MRGGEVGTRCYCWDLPISTGNEGSAGCRAAGEEAACWRRCGASGLGCFWRRAVCCRRPPRPGRPPASMLSCRSPTSPPRTAPPAPAGIRIGIRIRIGQHHPGRPARAPGARQSFRSRDHLPAPADDAGSKPPAGVPRRRISPYLLALAPGGRRRPIQGDQRGEEVSNPSRQGSRGGVAEGDGVACSREPWRGACSQRSRRAPSPRRRVRRQAPRRPAREHDVRVVPLAGRAPGNPSGRAKTCRRPLTTVEASSPPASPRADFSLPARIGTRGTPAPFKETSAEKNYQSPLRQGSRGGVAEGGEVACSREPRRGACSQRSRRAPSPRLTLRLITAYDSDRGRHSFPSLRRVA
jgi:hypothetical protein